MKKFFLIPTLFFFALTINAQTPSFQDFLKQFPAATLPYTFNSEDLQQVAENGTPAKAKRLDWQFYQFLPELERSAAFCNMAVHPEPVASFETKQYYAVLYNIARGLSKTAKTYSISVFDKKGNYVGTHFVAGVNAKTMTVATIDQALNASVKAYEINWLNNSISGLRLTDMQSFELVTPGNPDEIEWVNRELPQGTTADLAKSK